MTCVQKRLLTGLLQAQKAKPGWSREIWRLSMLFVTPHEALWAVWAVEGLKPWPCLGQKFLKYIPFLVQDP